MLGGVHQNRQAVAKSTHGHCIPLAADVAAEQLNQTTSDRC
jgi:hypothetical protein